MGAYVCVLVLMSVSVRICVYVFVYIYVCVCVLTSLKHFVLFGLSSLSVYENQQKGTRLQRLQVHNQGDRRIKCSIIFPRPNDREYTHWHRAYTLSNSSSAHFFSLVWCLTDKGEHTALYKLNKSACIKSEEKKEIWHSVHHTIGLSGLLSKKCKLCRVSHSQPPVLMSWLLWKHLQVFLFLWDATTKTCCMSH